MLLLLSDGSDMGQCTVAYLRWEMTDESVQVRIVTSRVKIASMRKVSTPVSELLAAQLSARLKVWLVTTMNIELGKVMHMVNSSIGFFTRSVFVYFMKQKQIILVTFWF